MTLLSNDASTLDSDLVNKSVEELLLLVADDDLGLKVAAVDILLDMGFDRLYPQLETWVRNNDHADLRNSAMDLLVRFGSKSLSKLIGLLQDNDEEVRNFAAVMLGDIGNRKAVEALIKALRDEDANVSHSAAEALGKIGDRAALFPLIELLKGDFWVQYSAIAAIGAMRDYRAVPHLLQLLDHELLSGPVIDALGDIGDARALFPLGRILPQADIMLAGKIARAMMLIYKAANESLCFKNSLAEYHQPEHLKHVINRQGSEKLRVLLNAKEDAGTVAAAIMLFGWLEDLSALPLFYQLIEDETYLGPVEEAILSIGRQATSSLVEALHSGSDNVKIVALRSLLNFGALDNSIDLVPLLTSQSEELQLQALDAMSGTLDSKLIVTLQDLFVGGSVLVCNKSAEVLGRYPFSLLVNFVESFVQSENVDKRLCGAILLCYQHEEGGCPLLDILLHDADTKVRIAALRAAGIQRNSAALPLIGAALADPEVSVREAAVMALAEFRTPLLVDDLLALLGSSGEALDFAIIRTLGMMAASTAEEALLKYLGEGLTRRIEYVLLETLGKIAAKTASEVICSRYLAHCDADMRRLAVDTLGHLGDGNSLIAVEEALKDPHWSVRVAALHVIGRLGGVKEMPLLLEAVADTDMMVKKHAILILGDLRNITAIPVLIQQLTNNEMSRHAFVALLKYGRSVLPWLHRQMMKNYTVEVRERLIDLIGKIGDPKSLDPLMELLDDPAPEIRLAAIDSLAFCFESKLLKKLTVVRNSDCTEEVKERADLALKTFTMEKYN